MTTYSFMDLLVLIYILFSFISMTHENDINLCFWIQTNFCKVKPASNYTISIPDTPTSRPTDNRR